MARSLPTQLLEATAALAASEPERALPELLEAWRRTRDRELARLIEAVSCRIDRPPIEGKTAKARLASWHAIEAARDPADLHRLAAAVLDGTCAQAKERLARLAERAPDPRLGTLLADLVESRVFSSTSNRSFWTLVLGLLVRTAEPRLVERLERVSFDHLGNLETFLAERLSAILPALVAELADLPALGEPDRRTVEELLERERSPVASEPELEVLLARILAHPEDDELRLVYADALLERGDPRGELIQLQIQRPGTSRERTLLKKHPQRLLGPLAPAVGEASAVFARGFLDACTVVLRNETQRALIGHPLWGTLREVRLERGGDLDFVLHPAMVSLRIVQGLDLSMVLALLASERRPPLELLGFSFHGVPRPRIARLAPDIRLPPTLEERDQLAQLGPSAGALRRVSVDVWSGSDLGLGDVAWLLDCFPQVEELSLSGLRPFDESWLSLLGKSSIPRLTISDLYYGHVTLTRTGPGSYHVQSTPGR
jgi:uncharacterized protein (TIGR02996 family)